jgi:hypothetical protein
VLPGYRESLRGVHSTSSHYPDAGASRPRRNLTNDAWPVTHAAFPKLSSYPRLGLHHRNIMYPLTSKLRTWSLSVLAGALVGSTAHATILWDGDASKGTGVFSSLNIENNPGQINVVTDSTYGKVFQFICYDNGSTKVRTEGSHMAGFQPVAGGTYYFGWRHKWGPLPTLCGKWQVLEQIHLNGSTGPVPFGLHVDGCDTNMHWQYNDPSGTSHDFLVQPFPLNSWHSFVYHEKWSESETDGYVEVWYDGNMKTLTNGSTRYPAAWCFPGELSYWKWGVYRSGSGGPIGTSYAYLWRARAARTDDVLRSRSARRRRRWRHLQRLL